MISLFFKEWYPNNMIEVHSHHREVIIKKIYLRNKIVYNKIISQMPSRQSENKINIYLLNNFTSKYRIS
jgi:hypothetical protein